MPLLFEITDTEQLFPSSVVTMAILLLFTHMGKNQLSVLGRIRLLQPSRE